jgi:bifunctional DNA-binding transcriptional regulator/antitoxin component of YhaV-PrlF toxin-antitoxin module
VTVPVEIRRHLGVRQGDKLSFVIEDDGTVELKVPKYPTVASLAGAAGTIERPMSWDQVRELAREDRFEAKHKDL